MSIMNKKYHPSVLAMEKKLCPSDGFMFGSDSANKEAGRQPLKLIEKFVRGTFAFKNANAASSTKQPASPNPQLVDNCALGHRQDTLSIDFTLKVLGNLDSPASCNGLDQVFMKSYKKFIGECIENDELRELGMRYAYNIACGRTLWRNRVGATDVLVDVSSDSGCWSFKSSDYGMNEFIPDNIVLSLGEAISKAISGREHTNFTITTSAVIGYGQDVYPSQEMTMGAKKTDKSKVLYAIDGIAAMHSQKLGNALRTIDTWYPNNDDGTPIPVEAFGAVTSTGEVHRKGRDDNFFDLMYKGLAGECSADQRSYLLAMFVRGGVFGSSDKGQ